MRFACLSGRATRKRQQASGAEAWPLRFRIDAGFACDMSRTSCLPSFVTSKGNPAPRSRYRVRGGLLKGGILLAILIGAQDREVTPWVKTPATITPPMNTSAQTKAIEIRSGFSFLSSVA